MIMLEGAKATTDTVDALRTGASAMKAMQKATCVALFIIFKLLIYSSMFRLSFMLVLKPEKCCILGYGNFLMHVAVVI